MKKTSAAWAIAITGLALFMASLDNLVVTTALPVIRVRLHAGLSGLEWTVNAYTLTFAVLLLSAAAIGERFGRRRIFILGIAVFTAASAGAALAPSIGVLVVARAIQGAGGAMVMPLSLTLLSAAVLPGTPQRRARDLGGHRRRGRGHRSAGGRRDHHRVGLAVHLLAQRAGRDRADRPGLVEALGVPRPGDLDSTSAACSWPAPGSSAWSTAWSRATPTDGQAPRCSGRSSGAPSDWPPSCGGSCGPPTRCCRSACSATGRSRR